MATAATRALRAHIRARAEGRYEYCHLPEEADFVRYEIDHVIAEQHGGATDLENLAYACFDCNKSKGPNLASIDPLTSERTWLFHPRTQKWDDHFRLNDDGTMTGLTAEGRTTVRLLKLRVLRHFGDCGMTGWQRRVSPGNARGIGVTLPAGTAGSGGQSWRGQTLPA